MATAVGKLPTRPSKQYFSADFVESCGAILFDMTHPRDLKICLIRVRDNGEWHMAKGRRNHGESRHEAALREVSEETGHRCRLLPVTMPTRATPPDAPVHFQDQAHVIDNLTEPFACTVRQLKGRTKMIFWYIAALEQPDGNAEKLPGEELYEPVFLPIAEAANKPTFQQDREILAKAIELVLATLRKDQVLGDDYVFEMASIVPNQASVGNDLVDGAAPDQVQQKAKKLTGKALGISKGREYRERKEYRDKGRLTRGELRKLQKERKRAATEASTTSPNSNTMLGSP